MSFVRLWIDLMGLNDIIVDIWDLPWDCYYTKEDSQ